MAQWLKLSDTYTFSTSPNLCHRITLLNTDVLGVLQVIAILVKYSTCNTVHTTQSVTVLCVLCYRCYLGCK